MVISEDNMSGFLTWNLEISKSFKLEFWQYFFIFTSVYRGCFFQFYLRIYMCFVDQLNLEMTGFHSLRLVPNIGTDEKIPIRNSIIKHFYIFEQKLNILQYIFCPLTLSMIQRKRLLRSSYVEHRDDETPSIMWNIHMFPVGIASMSF